MNSAFFGRTQKTLQRKDKQESEPRSQPQIQRRLWLGSGLQSPEAKKEAELIKTVGIALVNICLAASRN